jgi:thiamine transporter
MLTLRKIDIPINNNYPNQGFRGAGNLDLAERTTKKRRRPLQPDPGNTGGGKEMEKNSTIFHTRILAEIIIFSALSGVLYTIRPFTLPYGGSITLGSMVPTMWLSLRRGIRVGVIAGAVFGVLALLIDVLLLGAASVVATPVQAVLEYPVAFGLIGLAGMFHSKTVRFAIAGAAMSTFLRFLVHYFVGAFVWYYVYAFPAGYGQYVWPAVYNGSFLIVEFIISALLLAILIRRGTLEFRL